MGKKSILGEFINKDIKQLAFNNQIENIHYTKIKPAMKNRTLRRIDELASDIAEAGLENSITVRKIEDPDFDYELIAGERRYTAIKHNIEKGDMTYEYIPSKVVTLNDLEARKRLILNNYQNDPLTISEKLDAVEELKQILKEQKAAGVSITGKLQDIIANELGMKKSQIGNYEKVLNNAVDEVREKIEDGKMTLSAAAELSSLEEEEQLMFIENAEDFDIKTVREFKQEEANNDEIDDSNFEDECECDDSLELTSISVEKVDELEYSGTVQQNVEEINKLYEFLSSKIVGVEWKEEQPYLEEAIKSFNQLKTALGL